LFVTVKQTPEVKPERVQEQCLLIKQCLVKIKASKQQLQSLIGKLVFISRCVYASRMFTFRMLATLRSLENQRPTFYPYQPLAAWGIVMAMTDGWAAVVQRAALVLFTL